MTQIIGMNNILVDVSAAVITSDDEDTGYEKENAYDYDEGSWWKGAAAGTRNIIVDAGANVDCDYFGFFAQTLSDNSGTIQLLTSDTGTSGPWDALSSVITPTDTSVGFETFTKVSKRYYKTEVVDSGSPSQIGVINFGERYDLPFGIPTGYTPAKLSHDDTISNLMSESGNFLHRVRKRKAAKFQIMMHPQLTAQSVRDDWDAFIIKALDRPFFYQYDSVTFTDEVAYSWAEGKIQTPAYNKNNRMRVGLQCRGKLE